MYECLTSEEAIEKKFTIPEIGEMSVRVLLKDGFPKRLSLIRNGMVITDSLEKFEEPFRSFPMYKEFVALVEPLDPAGSTFIKKLENPKHDGLSAERITDEAKRKKAVKAVKKLAKEM